MGKPVIFGPGGFAKALTPNGFQTKAGQIIQNNGASNFIDNPHAEINTAGYVTYADAAASTPVDGTGGSPSITFSRNTTTPLRGNADFDIAKGAVNEQGEGLSFNFTLDEAQKNSNVSIFFDYKTGGSFVSDDVRMFVFDITGAQILSVNPDDGLKVGTNRFQGTFPSSGSTSYRLIFHIATTNASAWDLNFDSVFIGPQTLTLAPSTQIFTSGSGTYTTPVDVNWIRVRIVGGGGGGGGSGTGAGTGGSGIATTFGTMTGNGGTGATAGGGQAGIPGTATGGDINITGGRAWGAPLGITNGFNGGRGGDSQLGFGGPPGVTLDAGIVATGFGGGGGGASNNVATTGSPGGSGAGYAEKIIVSPAATFSFAVGAAGAGGTAGTSGDVGGAGTAGIIIVEEFRL